MSKNNNNNTDSKQLVETEAEFDISQLRENCKTLFGVDTFVFDGATFGLSGKFTVNKIKTTIEEWRNKEVK